MNNTNMSNYQLAFGAFIDSGSFADVKVHFDEQILDSWADHTLKLQKAHLLTEKKDKDWFHYAYILSEFLKAIQKEQYNIRYEEDPNFRYFEDLAELEAINYQTNL